MIKNWFIVIPSFYKEQTTDYQNQTAKTLAKKNSVALYVLYTQQETEYQASYFSYFSKYGKLKKIIQYKERLPQYFPPNPLPFVRYQKIRQLNEILNLIILRAYLLLRGKISFNSKTVLWIFDPQSSSLIPFFNLFDLTIFDCVDYFSSPNSKEKKIIKQQEKKLAKNADIMVVNSNSLFSFHKKHRKDIKVVPQGFRLKDFIKPASPKYRFQKNRPLIGYLGGINHRLDYSLLEELIKRNAKWNFALWGPIQRSGEDGKTKQSFTKLFEFPNVTHGMSKNKKEIPGIIAQFDVCLIPYDASQDFNKFCYPMKLFEYFYMGKPTVSTPIEELKRFPKYVKIGKDAREWEKHIKNLLSKPWPNKFKQEQRKLAEENSWKHKIEAISQVIEDCEKRRLYG